VKIAKDSVKIVLVTLQLALLAHRVLFSIRTALVSKLALLITKLL